MSISPTTFKSFSRPLFHLHWAISSDIEHRFLDIIMHAFAPHELRSVGVTLLLLVVAHLRASSARTIVCEVEEFVEVQASPLAR
jgi:hypothetical protein